MYILILKHKGICIPVEPVGSRPVIQVVPVAPEEAPVAPPSLKRKDPAERRSFGLTAEERSGMRAVRRLRFNTPSVSNGVDLTQKAIEIAKPAPLRHKPSAGLLRL